MTKSTMIRTDEKTHEALRELAEARGDSLQGMLARIVDQYRRSWVIAETNAWYAEQRSDPAAWAAIEADRAMWDTTVGDGLSEELFAETGCHG